MSSGRRRGGLDLSPEPPGPDSGTPDAWNTILVFHVDLFSGPVHSPYLTTLVESLPQFHFLILTSRPPGTESIRTWPDNVSFLWRRGQILHRLERRLPPLAARVAGVGIDIVRGIQNRRLLRTAHFNLIHVHAGVDVENLMRLGRKLRLRGFWVVARWLSDFRWTGRPVLFTEHSLFSRRSELGFPNPLHEADLCVTDAYQNIICVDRDAYRFLARRDEKAGVQRRRWFIPNGIDMNRFAFRPLSERSGLRIGYAGRIFRNGESRTFLTEVARRLPSGAELHLAVAQNLEEAEIRERWFPGARVFLKRNVPNEEMPPFYWDLDLLVNPLLWGGIGRTSLEAMSCGRPVAMFRNADRYPLSEDNGYLLPAEDVGAFLSLVDHLLSNRGDLSARGRRARETLETGFAETQVAAQTATVYRELLGSAARTQEAAR